MTVSEALDALRNLKEDKAKELKKHILAHGRVYPWVENEIKYSNTTPVCRVGAVAVCGGGVAAEAAYNGTGGEDDISFTQAVKNYERGE